MPKEIAKRRKLSAAERNEVYQKCNGHCAYCGKPITIKEMQVDHVVPLNGWHESGTDTMDNMLPACRSCNHYKMATSLELFRKRLERLPEVLLRDNVTAQIANRYGLVITNPYPVKFYFETMSSHNSKEDK